MQEPEFKCPNCARPLVSRRVDKCSYCGAALPENLKLTSDQQAFLDAEEKKLKDRVDNLKKENEPADTSGINYPA